MKVVFANQRLRLILTAQAHELGLPFGAIKSCRKKLELLRAATDERDLREWKSLNYKKLSGGDDGKRQIRINDQYRIVFSLDNDCAPPVITILEIGDTH